MNYYRELLCLLLEIIFSFVIIVFGYFIWENFDQTNYEIAKYYDNTKEVEIVYESNIDKGLNNNNSIVSVHNVSNKMNDKNIILKLNKENELNNIKLDINMVKYNLNDLFYKEDEIYNYYLIEKASFNGYETKVFFIDFELENNKLLTDYEFISEI